MGLAVTQSARETPPTPWPFLAVLLILAMFAPACAQGEVHELDIMGYNIWVGGQDPGWFPRDHEWLGVIKSRNPDVILIQEANGWLPQEENYISAYVDSLNNAFPDDRPHVGFVGEAQWGFHGALITRLPVLSFEAIDEVDIGGGETIHLWHVFVHAVLDAWGERVHVIGVHFRPEECRAERELEARALLAILDGLPFGETIWIGGDFNSYSPVDIEPGSPTPPDYGGGALPPEVVGWEPVGYLLDRGFEDAFRSMHPYDPGYTHKTLGIPPGAAGPIMRIDFMLLSPGGPWDLNSAEILADSLGHIGSDHYAVFATYRKVSWASVDIADAGRRTFSLRARPNPVDRGTCLAYRLEQTSPIRLRVCSAEGRVVRTLVDCQQEAGSHHVSWDGEDQQGRVLPVGRYLLRLDSDFGSESIAILKTQSLVR